MKVEILAKISILFFLTFLLFGISKGECDAHDQTYRHKSAVFYVSNARRIRVSVYNIMEDRYPRCYTAWIKINDRYVNLDGLSYSPNNWYLAWVQTSPNCFNSGYRIAWGYISQAEYDLSKYAPNGYSGIIEVRVSSDCYEIEEADPCFCWKVKVDVIEEAKYYRICTPGEVKNRRCACPSQIAYERCKSDGSGWETVIENCPSGYVCENGVCVLDKDGWYDTSLTRCNNGVLEKLQEYRDYTCFGATCTYIITQRRWIGVGSCQVTTTTLPSCCPPAQTEKDGWYETNIIRCNMNNKQCGYGIKEKMFEYRDYTCFGVTCTYTITQRKWVAFDTCYVSCSKGYECIDGICKKIEIFDCNSLDGWYASSEERCNIGSFECGYGVREVKEEYRDYYATKEYPKSSADCSFTVKSYRWRSVGTCQKNCPLGMICQSGVCQSVSYSPAVSCRVTLSVYDDWKNPVDNVFVCYYNGCFYTNSHGVAEFFVKPGKYTITISKEGYETLVESIECEACGNPIYLNLYLKRIQTQKFNCNFLDGWYYTTETMCDTNCYQCGPGILKRKEEYRDYPNIWVSDSSKCKDYKVVGYRWVEEGKCRKECSAGFKCVFGICKRVN